MLKGRLLSNSLVRALSVSASSLSPARPQLHFKPYLAVCAANNICLNQRAYSIFANMAAETTGPTPPMPPHDFHYTAETIAELADKYIDRNRKTEDKVAKLKPEDCTFDSVLLALSRDEEGFESAINPAIFMQSVSTDKAVRDAATEASKKISDYGIESSMRKDIYEALKHAQQNTPSNTLDAPSQRLLDRFLRDKRRAGLALPEDKQAKFKELKTKISNLCIEFAKNLDEEHGFLLFTKEELNGVPDDVVSGYTTVEEGGITKYKVTHKTPDIIPLLNNAKNPDTRKKAYISYENRSTINTPLFKEIMDLRKEAASILGYEQWADFVIETKMAKDAKTANAFLDDLLAKIKPIGEKERAKLLQLKQEDCEDQKIPFDDTFYAWDYRYLNRLYIDKHFQLNDEKVKQYLPVEHVVQKVLDIYQRILSVKIAPVQDAATWHKEVTVFSVWDKVADGQESAFLGYLYLDLFPRENKYGHAAVWGLIPRTTSEDGSIHYPVTAMVANLAKPTPTKPALLSHDDTVTFFHEMGHAFHGLLSKTKYGRFHGTSVARDFVEAPSQMLENWCYNAKVLKEISKHHESGEPMPDELINKIIDSQFINQGLFNLRQLYFGKFDLTVHGQTSETAPLDYTKLWNDLREQIALTSIGDVTPLPQGQSSFGHLTGGYDAGYYGYLYSQSFSVDMFETVFKEDPLSAEAGLRYRREILQPGGEREEMESLTKFLGRPPSNEAFMKKLLQGA